MRIAFFSLLLLSFFSVFAQSQNTTICRPGFTYEISQSPNWGKNKPVVTGITPYTSAEQNGLKINDVIEAIDGVPVTEITSNDIANLLNQSGKNEIILTISNVANSSKQVLIKKDCKRNNAITEDQLASAFAMYSLETTSERTFVCPFKTSTTLEAIDFNLFKSFAFSPIDESNIKLESIINESLNKELTKKGLTQNPSQPDFIIQTYYFFDKNPHFKGVNKILIEKQATYRFDFSRNKMEKFPFLSHTAAEAEAEYLLQLGIRFVDQRYTPGRVIWECEANEMLEDSYRLDDYARTHIPLMCMQYPYVKYKRNVQFAVNQKTYNYTGINYDINRLELVSDVDRNSPAYAAGIRARDVIEKIDRHSMNYSAEEFTAAYKQFITNTMKLRDPNTLFTDANGFNRCMFWDKFKYTQVVDAIQNSNSMAAFSYLFNYASYINSNGSNICTFQVKRGKSKMELTVRPIVRTEMSVEIK